MTKHDNYFLTEAKKKSLINIKYVKQKRWRRGYNMKIASVPQAFVKLMYCNTEKKCILYMGLSVNCI